MSTPKPKFTKQINGSSQRTTGKTLPPNVTKKESHLAQVVAIIKKGFTDNEKKQLATKSNAACETIP